MKRLYLYYTLLRIEVLKRNDVQTVIRILESITELIPAFSKKYEESGEIGQLLSKFFGIVKDSHASLRSKYKKGMRIMDGTDGIKLANFVPLIGLERILIEIGQKLKFEYDSFREESGFKFFLAVIKGQKSQFTERQFFELRCYLIDRIGMLRREAKAEGNEDLLELYWQLSREVENAYNVVAQYNVNSSKRTSEDNIPMLLLKPQFTTIRRNVEEICGQIKALIKKEVHEII